MKRIKYILVFCMLFILTGCVKFNANMEIKFDKSMNYSIIIAFDKSKVTNNEKVLTEEQIKLIEGNGFKVSNYSNGNMEGYTLAKRISNIDILSVDKDIEYELSGIISGKSKEGYLFNVQKGLIKNKYKAVLIFNPNDSGLNIEEINSSEMDLITDLNFNLSIPFGAISNNATMSENGNQNLTWNLSSIVPQKIEFEFYLYNLNSICIILSLFLIAITIIFFFIKIKRKRKKVVLANEEMLKPETDNDDDVIPEPVLKKKVIITEDVDVLKQRN